MLVPTKVVIKKGKRVVVNAEHVHIWEDAGWQEEGNQEKPEGLESLTKKELEEKAKEAGITIFGKKKAELIKELEG